MDKKAQMDFRNSFDIYKEVGFDLKEGADMILIKPGIIFRYNNKIKSFNVPILL